jgi:hypothetical protein
MVAAWSNSHAAGEEARMYALRRSDVEDLNELARIELRRLGLLGSDLLVAGERGYALGDEVLCLRNDRPIGVLNGTRGRIVQANELGVTMETVGGTRPIPLRYLEEGHLGYGYASTVHKAQGATVERAFVLAGDALYREAGYVAMSRASGGTDLFVVTSAFDADVSENLGREPSAPLDALSRSKAKQLALESLEPECLQELFTEESTLRARLVNERPVDPTPYRRALDADLHRTKAQESSVCPDSLLQRELDRVEALEATWERFHDTERDSISRLAELERAGQIRARLLGEMAAIEGRGYLPLVIGEPPAGGLARSRWVAAAGQIEEYRCRFDVTDDSSPLGPEPIDSREASAREDVASSLRSLGFGIDTRSRGRGR